tara:strand:+ start:36488 stop:36874 length:387 start_codon:yes stop_codon:yes gene_type:complete
MKATQDYSAALYEIQAATLSDKIDWKQNKPDSYTFKTVNNDLEDLILTLQKIEGVGDPNFLFSLVKKDFDSSEVLLNLDSSTNDKGLRSSLEELYNFVEYHVDMKNLDGLKDFIDTIKGDNGNSNILD